MKLTTHVKDRGDPLAPQNRHTSARNNAVFPLSVEINTNIPDDLRDDISDDLPLNQESLVKGVKVAKYPC